MKKVVGIILILIGAVCPTVCILKSIQFRQECSGYLKQAADANTTQLALERIDVAIEHAEKHHLTEGYTSVLYKTEDENIGFWYKNLLACRSELESCIESSQLEQTNVLMKVRESLMDGEELTIPNGISRYPQNLSFAIFNTISVLLLLCGFNWIWFDSDF